MAKKLVLKNYYLFGVPSEDEKQELKGLQVWLGELKLHGKESRSRTRFIKIILDRVTEIDKERVRLLEDNAKKKNGEIVYLTIDEKETTKKTTDNKSDGVRIKIKDLKKFNKEWIEYLGEDYILDVTPETQDTIYGVRDILLNTNEEFIGAMAARYEEWSSAFEAIK